MKKKVEYTKSVVVASLVVSIALVLFGIYLIVRDGDYIQGNTNDTTGFSNWLKRVDKSI